MNKYYFVRINSGNGNIQSCDQITEQEYEAAESEPVMVHGAVRIKVESNNPKSAQRKASGVFNTIRDRLQGIY